MNRVRQPIMLAVSLLFALSLSISGAPGNLDLTLSGYKHDGKSALASPAAAPPIASASNEDGIERGVSGNFAPKGFRITTGPNQPSFDADGRISTTASVASESLLSTGVGPDGRAVFAIAVMGNDVYVGGSFNTAGEISANYIARWTGTDWSPLGSGMNGSVTALAVSANGDLYAGGSFTTAGGVSANHIAKWNGSSWSPVGSGTNATVWAIAVSGSDVYGGGDFTTAGGVSAKHIAKWDGSSWLPLGSGMTDRVNALAVSGSDVYAGGRFTTAGGAPANKIAKWDGSNWSALSSGIGSATNSQVNAIAVSGSTVYAGGFFTTAGGSSANSIAKWDGSSWSPLGSGVVGAVNALAFSGSGSLYVGGDIDYAGGIWANNMAEWNGSNWSRLGSGLSSPAHGSWVLALAISGNGIVYAGGYFTTAGGHRANNIAMWNGNGWSALARCTAAITVLNTNDSGAGSLRQAIVDICSGGLIDFDPSVFATPQTIALTSGELVIDNTLTIRGPGRSLLSISGNDMSRVFLINGGSTATLDRITIKNGYAGYSDDGYAGDGAGITNHGVLTVSNSTISGNSAGYAGGIRNLGTMTVINSTISGNTAAYADGGVGNNGTMTVTTSIISGNRAGGAGAIWNGGWLTVTDTAISDNRAGGGADSYYDFAGGAIYNEGGMLAISNSTMSGNSANSGGGIYNTYYENNGVVYVINSTLSNNQGGGIFSDSSDETLRNTIVAGNAGTTADISGTIETASHNLIGDAGSSSGIVNGTDGNIVGANPMLGPLQNNGGPTFTHALLSESPAINTGDNCVLTVNGCGDGNPALPTDQRGMPRNDTVDIGSFERQASDINSTCPNPIDCADFFISQQYLDFLGREPEGSCAPGQCGLDFYMPILNGCGNNAECVRYTRGALSANFFRSPEFQAKGVYVMNLYLVTIGQRPTTEAELQDASKVERPHYAEFATDMEAISGPADRDGPDPAKKTALTQAFVQRAEIVAKYPTSSYPTLVSFGNALAATAGVTLSSSTQNAIAAATTRAEVLQIVAESVEVNTKFYQPTFVTMEYFGYLRRDPDNCHDPANWWGRPDARDCGFIYQNRRFNELLPLLGSDLTQNFMVRGFMESSDYRGRFGLP